MSIQVLPQTTVRLIGASQAVTDAASVVKELIDNALDARATAIVIEISANSLDSILVRDNGHGIGPEDRDMLCRRYCTSKIRDYSDLESVGGKTLGFRGEALASAAELCDTLTITTRVDGEDTAIVLKVDKSGKIHGRDRASHPVGTTMKLTNLFENIPVRKQTALKASSKYLARIKRCVQSYAFARPSVRYSLKLLKARNDRGNWMYAPNPDGDIQDAAFKIVGKECASQCAWSVVEYEDFKVQAFLPTLDADAAKINNIGQFLSVDARPVSATRGILKQITTRFKDSLKASMPISGDVKDPFLFLNIICPPNSYDPNVEPAKDDVVFESNETVLAAVQKLLDRSYPYKTRIESAETLGFVSTRETVDSIMSGTTSRLETRQGSFNVHEDAQTTQNGLDSSIDARPPKRQCIFRSNMRDFDEEDLEMSEIEEQATGANIVEDAEEARGVRNAGIRVSNPWTLAKMNASLHTKQSGVRQRGAPSPPLQELTRSDVNSDFTPVNRTRFPEQSPWALPTPSLTSLKAVPESSLTLDSDRSSPPIGGELGFQAQALGQPGRQSRLMNIDDDSFYRINVDSRASQHSRTGRSTFFEGQNDFVSAKTLPLNVSGGDGFDEQATPSRRARNRYNRASREAFVNRAPKGPFKSPTRPINTIADHPYLHSSPPPMPSNPGFTPINGHTSTRNANQGTHSSSPDIRLFLERLRNTVPVPRARKPDDIEVVDNTRARQPRDGTDYDSDATLPTSAILPRACNTTTSPIRHDSPAAPTPRFPCEVPGQQPNATRATDSQLPLLDLHNIILKLHSSIESLSSLASKLDRLDLSRTLFDMNRSSDPADPGAEPDSTFANAPPEPQEMEYWRRQLLEFLQQGDGMDMSDVDVDIDIEGAVGALEYERVDQRALQSRGGQAMYGSQETDILIT